jgi:ABC-type multidrug transport system fused ATPase/permease subunit
VPERPWLFAGTVAENIRLARPDATDDEVLAAARRAGAYHFVSKLPEGFGTPIGEDGTLLSGGERQRLAIARAFLRAAPLLILDEPTAHLDEGSQDQVISALEGLARGRTVLLIAHRPQLVRAAHVVVRMEAGKVTSAPLHLLEEVAGRAGRDRV